VDAADCTLARLTAVAVCASCNGSDFWGAEDEDEMVAIVASRKRRESFEMAIAGEELKVEGCLGLGFEEDCMYSFVSCEAVGILGWEIKSIFLF